MAIAVNKVMPRGALRAGVVLASVLGLSALAFGGSRWHHERERSEGEALFRGQLPLSARIVGHDELLPTLATRCINCHESNKVVPAALKRDPTEPRAIGNPYAARLDQAWLTAPRSRRGGPASAYDAESLCTVLRTGVDPAQVIVKSVMPRFDATQAQCSSLWAYLASR